MIKIKFKIKINFKFHQEDSRFKIQDLRIIKIKIQDSKIQELREELIKKSIKKFFKTLSSTRSFSQNHYQRVLLSGNRLPDCSNRLPVL